MNNTTMKVMIKKMMKLNKYKIMMMISNFKVYSQSNQIVRKLLRKIKIVEEATLIGLSRYENYFY